MKKNENDETQSKLTKKSRKNIQFERIMQFLLRGIYLYV